MGTGQTFDMLVHLAGGTASEFKNISMAEADRLVAYLQGSRIRVGGRDSMGLGPFGVSRGLSWRGGHGAVWGGARGALQCVLLCWHVMRVLLCQVSSRCGKGLLVCMGSVPPAGC